MIYKQLLPSTHLSQVVKNYWMIDGEDDKNIRREKIIPDGYPELIYHYKDPYKSNINGYWQDRRDESIIAGQIKNHFYIENTGYTGMFALKFQPWVFKSLFNIEPSLITDKTITIPSRLLKELKPLRNIAFKKISFEKKVKETELWLTDYVHSKELKVSKGDLAVELIINSNGQLELDDMLEATTLSERSLERYFKDNIGLTPKFYCRIIRFSNIFRLISSNNPNWTEISLLAGFYDQSHFIKNFKEFTGEAPSRYGFFNNNLANQYLKL